VPIDRRVMVTFSDVSEIIEANFRIDTHFFLSPDLICLIDNECKIQKVNPSFGATLGYEDSELLGVNFLDLVVLEDLSEAREFFDHDVDRQRSAEFEYRFKNKKGGFNSISWVAQSDSRTKSWYAVGRDVTSERIRNSDFHQLNAAINSSSLVSSTDVHGVIVEANSNFCKLSGYTRQELVGKSHRIINSGYHGKQFFASMWSTIKSGKAWTGDIQNRAKDGSIYWVRSLITPILNFNNEIERFLSIRFDVSSIYEKESALKSANLELELEKARGIRNAKLASLGEMSAGIAHEINNPLTIIGSTARILTKYVNDPEKIAQKAKTIEASVERMAKIVRGLKKFSRTSPNSDMKVYKLESIIHESTTLIESKSKTDGVPVHFKASFDGFIYCDEIEIQQVMINLISNAIDAVKSLDDRWVNIELISEEGKAVVYIRDAGKGIPREIVDKLFLPFFTTKDVGDGTGLGLSIVKGILDAHSASIEVKSDEPNTCFEVKFPIYTQS
jgi:PAS domain S-box-containing protein